MCRSRHSGLIEWNSRRKTDRPSEMRPRVRTTDHRAHSKRNGLRSKPDQALNRLIRSNSRNPTARSARINFGWLITTSTNPFQWNTLPVNHLKRILCSQQLENAPNQQIKPNVYSNLQLSHVSGIPCESGIRLSQIK